MPLLPLHAASAEWAEPDCDARICFTVSGDLFNRAAGNYEIYLNFNDWLGAERTIAADALIMRAKGGNEKTPLDVAEDAEIRFASGNPILRLRWNGGAIKPFAGQVWELYFRTVKSGDPAAWKSVPRKFMPSKEGLIFSTSFEEPDPKNEKNPLGFSPAGQDQPGEKTDRSWSAAAAHTGKRSLKISRKFEGEAPKNTNRPFWWNYPYTVAVKEGATYKLGVWIKSAKMAVPGTASVNLYFVDEKKGTIPNVRVNLQAGSQPHDWAYLTGTAVAPPGARYLQLSCCLYQEGETYFDDLAVTVVPGSELPQLAVTPGRIEDRSEFMARADELKPLEGKEFHSALAKAPPRIDGLLDDECWKAAGKIEDFVPFMAVSRNLKTTVFSCADRAALYFAFECLEPDAEKAIVARAAERDGAVWSDTSVEIFLDTRMDGRTYYQIILNARGVFFDQDTGAPGLPNEAWNGPIEAATRIAKDKWTAEVRIGLAGLRLAETKGRMWRANFCRTSFTGGARDLYAWVKTTHGFGEPESFGRFIMPFEPSAEAVTGRLLTDSTIYWGAGTLPVLITNQREKPVEVRAIVLPDTNGVPPLGEIKVSVPPKGTAEARIPCVFNQSDKVKLRYELREAPGDRLLYVTAVAQNVPEPLKIAAGTFVSYASELVLAGTWKLGVAQSALPDCKLAFTINAGGKETARQEIKPQNSNGMFAVPADKLPAGNYELKAELLLQEKAIKNVKIAFERVTGPFAAPVGK